MSALFDDDREAERIAAEYVAEQYRIQDVEAAADALNDQLWPQLVASATARLVGDHTSFEALSEGAYHQVHAIQDLDVRAAALIRGLWPYAVAEAEEQLKVLRDFHYIDQRDGLIPVPPVGRHRAPEEP